MANKKRKCLMCKNYHVATDGIVLPVGFFCSLDHALDYSRLKRLKQQEKENREAKKATRPKSWYTKEAQRWFNKFIRLRDAQKPCISCGRHHKGQYHAGHYKTVGSSPELRFNELNCHKQCAPCNNRLSGNIVNYRLNLIKKIGLSNVDWLESSHESLKLSIDDLETLIATYKKKYKDLKSTANSD